MTRIVPDEVITKFAIQQHDWMGRVLKGSIDPEEVAKAVQEVIDRGGFITVDRSIRPTYPDWMKEVLYPKLEATGPTRFNAFNLEHRLHDDQKNGFVSGNKIFEHLKENDMLEGCLGLRDLEEIQKKGINFFRRSSQGKFISGWKSIVRDSGGNLRVPYLVEHGGRVVLFWGWADGDWSSRDPALRFT